MQDLELQVFSLRDVSYRAGLVVLTSGRSGVIPQLNQRGRQKAFRRWEDKDSLLPPRYAVWDCDAEGPWEPDEQVTIALGRTGFQSIVAHPSHDFEFLFSLEKPSPEDDLLCAFAFACQKAPTVRWQAISQFREKYSDSPVDIAGSRLLELFEMVDKAVQVNNSEELVLFALATTGLLEIGEMPREVSMQTNGMVLETVGCRLKELLPIYSDVESVLVRGVAHQLQLSSVRGSSHWQSVLPQLISLPSLLSELAYKHEFQRNPAASLIADTAKLHSIDYYVAFCALVLHTSRDLPTLASFLAALPDTYQLSDSEFQESLAAAAQELDTLAAISDVLNCLKSAREEIVEMLRNAGVNHAISSFPFEECEPSDETFSVFSAILRSAGLFSLDEKRIMILRFVLKCQFPVSIAVGEVFESDEKAAVLVWERWVKSTNTMDVVERVQTVSAQLAKVADDTAVKRLSDMFVRRLSEESKDCGEFLSLHNIVALEGGPAVAASYLRTCRDVLSAAENKEMRTRLVTKIANSSLKLLQDDPNPSSFDLNFITMLLELHPVPDKKRVATQIYTGTWDEAWVVLLQHCSLFSASSKYVKKLRKCLFLIASDIETCAVLLSEGSALIRLSEEWQRRLSVLLACSAAGGEERDYRPVLADLFAKVSALTQSNSRIAKLLDFLEADFPAVTVVKSSFQSFVLDCQDLPIRDISLPYEFHGYRQLSIDLQPFYTSCLFRHYLVEAKVATPLLQVILKDVEQPCSQALSTMKKAVTSVLAQGDSCSVNTVLKMFAALGDSEARITPELTLLRPSFPGYDSAFDAIEKALRFDRRKAVVRSHCELLILLEQNEVIEDHALIDHCRAYIQTMGMIGNEPIQRYIAVCETIEQALYQWKEAREMLAVLSELYTCAPLLSFLNSLTDTNIAHLKEGVSNYEETNVTPDVIEALEAVWAVHSTLKRCRGGYYALLESVAEVTRRCDLRQLQAQVAQCQAQLNCLDYLTREVENKGEARMAQIEAIVESSQLRFAQCETRVDAVLCYSPPALAAAASAPMVKSVHTSELVELKERAALVSSSPALTQSMRSRLEKFLSITFVIQQTASDLQVLAALGYPEKLAEEVVLLIRGGESRELQDFAFTVHTLVAEWENALHQVYSASFKMTFFYGRQFWVLERFFQGEETSRKEAEGLLSFALLDPQLVQSYSPQRVAIAASARLAHLSKTLSEQREISRADVPPSREAVASVSILPGSLLYIESNDSLSALVTVYLSSGQSLPMPHQVLMCSSDTIWAEVQAFAYRCFTSKEKRIYAIIHCERLTVSIQANLRDFVLSLVDKPELTGSFRLAVISGDSDCLFSAWVLTCTKLRVSTLHSSQLLDQTHALSRLLASFDERFEVVVSAAPGCGKSTYVARRAKQLSKEPIPLYLAGYIDRATICDYLLTHFSDVKLIHVQLSLVDDFEAVDDLLLTLGLFRSVVSGDRRVCLPFSYVIVEVANLQPSIEDKVGYLKYVKRTVVQFSEADIEISEALFHTCKYLQLLETQEIDTFEVSDINISEYLMRRVLHKRYISAQLSSRQPLSYRSLKSFAEVFTTLISHFETGVLTVATVRDIAEELRTNKLTALAEDIQHLRSAMLECLFATAQEATCTSMSSVHTKQLAVTNPTVAPRYLDKPEFSSLNHCAIVFFENGAFVPIYRNSADVPMTFQRLMSTQGVLETRPTLKKYRIRKALKSSAGSAIPDFQAMSQEQLLEKIHQNFADRPDPDTQVASNEYYMEIEHAAGFVMTADTYLKMHLIYLRHMAGQPIVLMGETGCGKTFLIRYFVRIILRSRLLVFNIHAGTTAADLSEMIATVSREAKATRQKIWVFFDEFNTTRCVGLICEVVCERRYLTETLPRNVTFIVACNPLRLSTQAFEGTDIGLARRDGCGLLAHIVNPLPENVLEYVWDFGALSSKDTRAYVLSMLSPLPLGGFQGDLCSMISVAHDNFRDQGDWASASLRDVSRFRLLFKWFTSTLPVRLQSKPLHWKKASDDEKVRSDKERVKLAATLAFLYCYYLRIQRTPCRLDFLERIAMSTDDRFPLQYMLQCLEFDQNDLLLRMELPADTARNSAFKENVATLTHCAFNKIPLIICGKPGCSKTYAIQLLMDNCKGKKSKDAFFRDLPEMVFTSFQGSTTCTSSDILSAFARSAKYLRPGYLPVLVFDEISLAELSKDNPLKVLHGLLEVEEVSVAFVGVSNWRLDSSKMNRVLYLARPDPSAEDLVHTAMCLASRALKWEGELVKALGYAYYRFMMSPKRQSLYGLRDYYQVVRQFFNALSSAPDLRGDRLSRIVVQTIARNFGGLRKSIDHFIKEFVAFHNQFPLASVPRPPLLDLIELNFSSADSRYLMLIGSCDVSAFILESRLKRGLERPRMCVGSRLAKDLNSKEYTARALGEIVLCMEQGLTLVMRDMEHVYSALYGLFNQSFSRSDTKGRRYCQVAIGSHFHPRCPVHENFRVVTLLDSSVLPHTEAPFLNRFEKQRVDLEALMTSEELSTYELTRSWVEDLTTLRGNRSIELSINSVFPLYSDDNLRLLACSLSDAKACTSVLLETASDDLWLLSEVSKLPAEERAAVKEMLRDKREESFVSFVEKCGKRCVVFTQSCETLKTEWFAQGSVYISHFSAFREELDLIQDLRNFENSEAKVYLLDFNLVEFCDHMAWLRYIVEKTLKSSEATKGVIVVARYSRNDPQPDAVWWFPQWQMRYFNLPQSAKFAVTPLLALSTHDLLLADSVRLFDSEFSPLLRESYSRIYFSSSSPSAPALHVSSQIARVPASPQLLSLLKAKAMELVSRPGEHSGDWREEAVANTKHTATAKDLQSAVLSVKTEEVTKAVATVVYAIERESAFPSYFTDAREKDVLAGIWEAEFRLLKCEEVLQTTVQSNMLEMKVMPRFPFIRKDWRLLKDLYHKYQMSADAQPASALATFQQRFLSQSVISQFESRVNNSPELQEVYISDLINLLIEEESLDREAVELLAALQALLTAGMERLEEKVTQFFAKKGLMLQLCDLAKAWNSFQKVRLTSALTAALKASVFESEHDSLEFLAETVQALSLQLQPTQLILEGFSQVKQYAICIEKVFNCLKGIANSSPLEFPRLEVLDFWSTFSQLCVSLQIPPATISSVCCLGQELNSGSEGYVSNPSFLSRIISFLNSTVPTDSTLLYSFEMRYYSILVIKVPRYIRSVAHTVQTPERFLPCPAVVERIVDMCGIDDMQEVLMATIKREKVYDDTLTALETTLQEYSFGSRFAVLFSDSVLNRFEKVFGRDKNCLLELLEHFKECGGLLREEGKCVDRIVLFGFVRVYLDQYCEAVVRNQLESEHMREVITSVEKELSKEYEPYITLRLYCMKTLKKLYGSVSYVQFSEKLLSRKHSLWANVIDFSSKAIAQVPLLPLIRDTFDTTYWRLLSFCQLNVELARVDVPFGHTQSDRLALFVAFLKINESMEPSNLRQWLDANKSDIERLYTPAGYLLLRALSSGALGILLPAENRSNRVRILYLYISVLLTHAQYTSPLTAFFLTSDCAFCTDISTRFNSMYKFGAESSPELTRLYTFLRKLRIGRNNPRQKHVGFCPHCKSLFRVGIDSGTNCEDCGRPLPATTSTTKTVDKTIQDIESTLFESFTAEPQVYEIHTGMRPSDMPIRGFMRTASFRVMHLFLNTSLYFLYLSNQFPPGIVSFMQEGDDLRQYFSSAITQDFDVIATKVEAGVDAYQWMEAVILRTAKFIKSPHPDLSTVFNRRDFERSFEESVTFPESESSQVSVPRYCQSCEWEEFQWVRDAEELQPPASAVAPLFRLRTSGSFAAMQAHLQRSAVRYPRVELYLNNTQLFSALKCILPICEFVKELLQKYNHNISRAEAADTTIAQVVSRSDRLTRLFTTVKKQWNKHLATLSFESYGMTLPPREITDDDSLKHFLPDTKTQEGLYFTSALQYLAETQNRLIRDSELPESHSSSHIQKVSKDRIILIDLKKPRVFAAFWTCNPTYGRGDEVYFDFEGIDAVISNRIREAVVLTSDHLEVVQYQFDILSEATELMQDVEANISQSDMKEPTATKVEQFFTELKGKENYIKEMRKVLTALSTVLSYAVYTKAAPSSAIASLAKEIPDYQLLQSALRSLVDVPLGNIIALYELTERHYFPSAGSSLPRELKSKLQNEGFTLAQIRSFSDQHKVSIPSIASALQKLIIRCLLGRVEEKQDAGMYIARKDFWRKEVLSDLQTAELKKCFRTVPLQECWDLHRLLTLPPKLSKPSQPFVGKNTKPNPSSRRVYC